MLSVDNLSWNTACDLTNLHVEIHGNLLEDSGIITTKVE